MKLYPIGHTLKLIVSRFEAEANRALKPLGLTASQAQLLIILNNSTDTLLPQKKLEAAIGLSQATVAGIVSRLAAKNLITLSRDGEDRRIQLVAITPAGIKCCSKAFDIMKAAEEKVITELTFEDREIISEMFSFAD